MKKNEKNYKEIYRDKLVGEFKNVYSEFEIPDQKMESLYDNISSLDLEYTSDDELYYTFLYTYRKKIENYIMNECMNNNLLYQIMLAELEEKVVTRYLSLKKLYSAKKDISDISFSIMEKLIFDYDKNESIDNQYIKKLNQRFN